MQIGIDASRATVARRTGTESYALNLTRALIAERGRHALTLYFRDSPADGLFTDADQRVIPFPRLWTHVRLAWELQRAALRPDVLFVPAHVLPLPTALLRTLPMVVTVHDLGFRHFPDAHPFAQRLYLDWSTRFSTGAARRVIADSIATRRDLRRFYGVPEERIAVVYPGRDETFTRVDPAPVRARYQLPDEYVLHVGTLQPRKNLMRLIEAAPAGRRVLAGRPGWLAQPILERARARGVRLLEYVPDADLAGLYSGAAAFVFPSLYEGFGFPVLEAMACGTPVICASTSSLPEVAGEAAVLIDPLDTRALSEAIGRVLNDAALRAELTARGHQQVQRFSWRRTAREVLRVIEGAAG